MEVATASAERMRDEGLREEQDGPMSDPRWLTDDEQHSWRSRSRLSHAVARLEERGWVERTDCPTDKRGQLASLTDAGFAVVAAAAPGHVATVRQYLIDQLTPAQLDAIGEVGEVMLRTTKDTDLPPRRG